MGKLARLWNPRGNQKLRRHWISFEDQIVIGGETSAQAGVLSVRPASQGELRARLCVEGGEYEELVHAGNDIAIWINGLTLFIGVRAVDEERMLVAFGIAPGAKVNVTLETASGTDEDTRAVPRHNQGAAPCGGGCPVGLCQTSY